METEERGKFAIQVFEYVMRKMLIPSFSFPGGSLSKKTVGGCLASLEKLSGGGLSRERIIDFCVCQLYAVSRFDSSYLSRWKVNHSFGEKALKRFTESHSRLKYYEDRWLKGGGLSRVALLYFFKDRKEHPLYSFIYADWEEGTKQRMLSSEVGFYICQLSTLLWSPFSPSCVACKNAERCQTVLRGKSPELFRIRVEEFSNSQNSYEKE